MNIITAITNVFTEIGTWLVSAVGDLVPMFWVAETGLTLLGTLAVVALGISIIFLLIGLIQNFLHFKG